MPAAANSIYTVFYDSRFGVIDSTTGVYSPIGSLPIPAAAGIAVYANILFAQSMQGELIVINPVSGISTVVGSAGLATVSEVFAGAGNGLFEIDSLSNLYRINPNTGAATMVGPTGLPANNGGWDTSLSDDGTNLYFTAGGAEAVDELYRVDTTTGRATDLGSTGARSIAGSAIVSASLDLFQYEAGTNHIYSAPLDSTQFTQGPVLAAQIVDGGAVLDPADSYSAANSVPESGAFLLVGLGLIVLGLVRRNRFAVKDESRNAGHALR